MTFLSGFFLVNFLPFGIIILAGLLLFFTGRYTRESWYYPLLFIIITLIVISLWRIPLLIDRRYVMPVLVPGILVSVFVLINLPGVFYKFKLPYASAITRIIIFILLVSCIAKAMRVQENKDYLRDIAEIIRTDCQKNNIKGNVPLLLFGNPGGYLDLDKNIVLFNIDNRYFNAKVADTDYQFGKLTGGLHPDILKIRSPRVYLLCVEEKTGNFSRDWTTRYHDNPELVFEYTNPRNQIAYRLFRVLSKNKTAWYSPEEFDAFLKKNNIWANCDFSLKTKILSTDPAVVTLKKRGIDLGDNDFYLPAGWRINTGHGWAADCSPVSIEFSDGKALNVTCGSIISIYSSNVLSGRNKFLFAINAGPVYKGLLLLCVYKYDKNDKFIDAFILDNIKSEKTLILLESLNCDKIKLALLFSGEISIRNIMVIPFEAIAE